MLTARGCAAVTQRSVLDGHEKALGVGLHAANRSERLGSPVEPESAASRRRPRDCLARSIVGASGHVDGFEPSEVAASRFRQNIALALRTGGSRTLGSWNSNSTLGVSDTLWR